MKNTKIDPMVALEALLATMPKGVKLFADGQPLENLRAKYVQLVDDAKAIQDRADNAGRELTEAEQSDYDAIMDQVEDLQAKIERREQLEDAEQFGNASRGRRSTPQDPSAPEDELSDRAPAQPADRSPRAQQWGWDSFAEFSLGVQQARLGQVDDRLLQNAAGSESTGGDGGYLVPPEFRRQIMEQVEDDEESLLTLCDSIETSSNKVTVPYDATIPGNSPGVQAYWTGENAQGTESNPQFQEISMDLHKLMALVRISNEQLEDNTMLESYLRTRVPKAITAKINDAIIAGTGVGQPLGILNSDVLISVAKEGSQTADTVNYQNIRKMWARMYGPSRKRSIWLTNQDVEDQLLDMEFPGDSSPIYLPGGNISGDGYSTLFGRPVRLHDALQPLGDNGDIINADLSKYVALKKVGGGIKAEMSIHLYFDYDQSVFKFAFRFGGRPWWHSTITPRNSAVTRSCFTAIAERA